jgi:ankyrin repeat protein
MDVTSVLQEILRVYPSLKTEDIYGMNPIHAAALFGNPQCLKLLNPDKVCFLIPTFNARQDIPIHLVACGGNIVVIKRIVECGVRIDGRNRKGSTALDIAIERGNVELINLLQNIGSNMSANK